MRTIFESSAEVRCYFLEIMREVDMAKLSWGVSYHSEKKSEQENYIFLLFLIGFFNPKDGLLLFCNYQRNFEVH